LSSKLIYLIAFLFVTAAVSEASADLLGYWKLDENNGTSTADSSGYGNDGIINGAIWTSGKSGSALAFDGVDDYVLCAERTGTGPGTYPQELMPEKFTVSCWTKLDNFAYFSSFVGNGIDTGDDECGFFLYNWGWEGENERDFGLAIRTENAMSYVETPNIYETNTWYHLAATYDGTYVNIYVNGSLVTGPADVGGPIRWVSAASGNYPERFAIGVWLDPGYDLWIDGIIDEVTYWDVAMTEVEIKKLAGCSTASEPSPDDGAIHPDTWVNLSWAPGAYAVTHEVYLGDNFDDVNAGAESTFQGSQTATFIVAGFPGFPYPDGLVPGTTYYWRVDEVNDAEPNSPWRGPVWSFMVPPKTAYNPDPDDSAESVDPNAVLSWTAGFGAKLHTVYFGDNFDDVNNAAGGLPQGTLTYTPGPLKLAKTYYWRVDEFDAVDTYKGEVWSFTTEGAVGGPEPANEAVEVKQTAILSWTPGIYAASHQVYFGTDEEAVKNADTGSAEYKGTRALDSESYDPGRLEWDVKYYWRIDEVNDVNPDSPWKGNVWNFTTANFLIIDDFEDYDAGDNQIWYAWKDGLGYGTPGTDPYYAGNGSGSAVGDENTLSYTEETIVHKGNQSMPVFYDNNKQGFFKYSEAELTLTDSRDWTEKGVNRLTIWFRGISDNAAEPLYVALNGSAVVTNDNPDAALITDWTEWSINLQAFADQGVNLANVNTIALGFGDKNNPQAGGSGIAYFDDIRLYRPTSPEP
jgi:hypothetical protein